MSEHVTKRPAAFRKPAYWTAGPLPEPVEANGVEQLSPTRYGDWVRKGIAVDF